MRFLFTTFEGGGHVPPALRVAAALKQLGHTVLFVSDTANRQAAEAAELAFEPWTTAPDRQALGAADDPLRDWKPRLPHAIVREVCAGVMTGPAQAYAVDTVSLIERFRPDVIVSNELLFGVLAAAEATGVSTALLTANVWCFPTRDDLPPFGPGFAPAASGFGRRRDRAVRRMIGRWYDVGLADLNQARARLGLAPLLRCLDQLAVCDTILLGVSAAFDYGCVSPPAPFVYVGPLGQTPAWASGAVADLALIAPDRANVLVSFSTTHQDQAQALRRTVQALGRLEVSAIVTLGPAFAGQSLPRPPNVRIVERADHDLLVPRCDLVICHGGHGTVLRPLLHGKPVICIPTGRDQPENAQRIVAAGAGVRLSRRASVSDIRRAAARVLAEPDYAASARRLSVRLRQDDVGPERAVEALERLAARSRDVRFEPRLTGGFAHEKGLG